MFTVVDSKLLAAPTLERPRLLLQIPNYSPRRTLILKNEFSTLVLSGKDESFTFTLAGL